jgi:hypothetical protein
MKATGRTSRLPTAIRDKWARKWKARHCHTTHDRDGHTPTLAPPCLRQSMNKFLVKRDRKFGQSHSPYARIPKRFAQKHIAFVPPVALMRQQTNVCARNSRNSSGEERIFSGSALVNISPFFATYLWGIDFRLATNGMWGRTRVCDGFSLLSGHICLIGGFPI